MVCYQRLILSMAAVAALIGISGKSFAQTQPTHSSAAKSSLEKVLRQSFEVTRFNSLCYAQTHTPKTFDLTRLCGAVTAESNPSGTSGGVSSSSSGSNPNPSGDCNTPDDIASDGSRCGGRAASEKKGGR